MNIKTYIFLRAMKQVLLIIAFPIYFPLMLIGLATLWPIIAICEWLDSWYKQVLNDYADKQKQ